MADKILLVDYFERVTGTPEEQPYFEIVLYQYTEAELLLEKYVNGGTDEEMLTTYHVPAEAYEKALQIIKKYAMVSWNSRDDCFPLDGKLYVCKFREGPDFTRVSSDSMPEEGNAAFCELRKTLFEYIADVYLVKDTLIK
jgi:hypothetical protein